jgi:hypothetical protein
MVAVNQDVELAGYESSRIGPPPFRLTARARALHHIRALMGPLLLLSNEQSSVTRAVAHRLDALANGLSSGSRFVEVTAQPGQHSLAGNLGKEVRGPGTVDGIVMADLEVLESAFARGSGRLEAHASV